MLGSDGEVGHNTASSLTAGIGDQASGRVDVPGGVPQPAAALHERLGHSGGQEKNFLYQDENCKFPVFLRSLDGCTKVLQVHGYEKVSQVKQRISESVRVPGDCFYLTLNSKLLDEDALIVESGISRDMHISVCGRLRGGATYGEWVCSFCKRGGCWASKPFCFRCGQPRQNIPAGMGFPPNGYKGNFREQQHMGRKPTPQTMGDPSMRGPVFGRAPHVVEPRKPRVKPNNVEDTTQKVNQDMVIPVLEALGLPSELLEEVKKRLPLVKPPEKKKERALADLRDKLDKEKKHLERLASHAEKKRQEAEEAMQKHAIKQHEVDALELEVEQARIKAMVPTRCLHRRMSRRCLRLSNLMLVNEEGAFSDFDLAFGDDRGSIKKPKVDHPPSKRIPHAPPNPRDIEFVVNGGNYELDDLRKLRDLVDERLKTQASSSQLVPVSG